MMNPCNMVGTPDVCLDSVWRAGRPRRWHTHPDLAHTNDTLDGHHARVTKLMLALDPDVSREALIAALTHDDGEISVGDMSYQVKIKNPRLASDLADMERDARDEMWGFRCCLSEREQKLIELCDRLDSWLWVSHHVPHVLVQKEWRAMRLYIQNLAGELGLCYRVSKVL